MIWPIWPRVTLRLERHVAVWHHLCPKLVLGRTKRLPAPDWVTLFPLSVRWPSKVQHSPKQTFNALNFPNFLLTSSATRSSGQIYSVYVLALADMLTGFVHEFPSTFHVSDQQFRNPSRRNPDPVQRTVIPFRLWQVWSPLKGIASGMYCESTTHGRTEIFQEGLGL